MQRVCVYCASSPGERPEYREGARQFAAALVDRGLGLVYGGASKGIMGVLADSMLAAGGEVIGVIPKSLVDKEIAHAGLSELHVTDDMHERKSMMATLADGFVALPGGFGTLEEIIEISTWAQLGFHEKPMGLLNVAGYYDRLVDFFDHAVREGFVRSEHRGMLAVHADPHTLLNVFADYRVSATPKWHD